MEGPGALSKLFASIDYPKKRIIIYKHNMVKIQRADHQCTRGSDFYFNLQIVNTITFYYNAIKEWNTLAVSLKIINKKDSFKSALKSHMLECVKQRSANLCTALITAFKQFQHSPPNYICI